MPRKHIRVPGSRCYADYSKSALDSAIGEVKSGHLSIRKAAKKYSVNRSTLNRKIKGIHMQSYGRLTVLSNEEEEHLLQGILTATEWGFPLYPLDVRYIVKQFLDKKGITEKRFKENLPGDDWYHSFLQRHNDVSDSAITSSTAGQQSKEVLKDYFSNLEVSLRDVHPELILNFDETNLVDDPGRKKVLVWEGSKHPERVMDSSKVSHSVMFAGTASGKLLPPYAVYKVGHIYENVSHTSENEYEPQDFEMDDQEPSQPTQSTGYMILMSEVSFWKITFMAPSNKEVNKFYVGLIQSLNNGLYFCKLIRKSRKCEKTFVFPTIDDEWNFEKRDIVEVLPVPVVVRGRQRFNKISSTVMLQ